METHSPNHVPTFSGANWVVLAADSSPCGNALRCAHNKSFKPLAKLARTPSTPHLIAHGFAIIAQTALRTGRRLTWR